jgi:hypothetical protein
VRWRVNSRFAVLLGYTAISFAFFGWRLLPHPGRELVGAPQQSDAEIFIWSFAWWPHAILSWTNPFVSHVVYAPTGVNLAWVTSVPGLAVAFSPVTLLFGPSAAFNVAAVLLPALSAWTAFLLCRYVTRSTGASIVGGYLYGFSAYMLGHQFASHLNLTSVFLLPLAALLVLRRLRGELNSRGLAWRLGLLLAFQAYISTEVTVTLTLALVVGLALAFGLVRETRARIRSVLGAVVGAYALAAVLAAPIIYYALTGLTRGVNVFADYFSADLLNVVLPTHLTGLGGSTFSDISGRFPGNDAERGAYVGLPTLLIVGLFARRWRAASTRFLLAAFALAVFLSLGTGLFVDGHRVAWLPWSIWAHSIGFEQIIPSRLIVYAVLAAAVMVAMWVSTTKGRVFQSSSILPVLAVAALIPPVWRADDVFHPPRWSFFSEGLYKKCLPRDETVMIFPFGRWGDSLLWQAETGFWFKMVDGTLGHNDQPRNFVSDPTIYKIVFQFLDPATHPSMEELRGLATRRRVDRIVSAPVYGQYPDQRQITAFGPTQQLGGVWIAPLCGEVSLAGDRRPAPGGEHF